MAHFGFLVFTLAAAVSYRFGHIRDRSIHQRCRIEIVHLHATAIHADDRSSRTGYHHEHEAAMEMWRGRNGSRFSAETSTPKPLFIVRAAQEHTVCAARMESVRTPANDHPNKTAGGPGAQATGLLSSTSVDSSFERSL
jgi:hypothetical protein